MARPDAVVRLMDVDGRDPTWTLKDAVANIIPERVGRRQCATVLRTPKLLNYPGILTPIVNHRYCVANSCVPTLDSSLERATFWRDPRDIISNPRDSAR